MAQQSGLSGFLSPEDGPVLCALTGACYDLLRTRTAQELTISDLVTRASVSRSSFYRHFKDKYDLINFIHLRVLEGTLLTYFEGAPLARAVCATWDVFTRHKRYFRNALTASDMNSLGNFLFSQTYLFYQRALEETGFRMTKEQSRVLRQYSFGSVALLSEWLLGEMEEALEEYMQASLSGLPRFVRVQLGW